MGVTDHQFAPIPDSGPVEFVDISELEGLNEAVEFVDISELEGLNEAIEFVDISELEGLNEATEFVDVPRSENEHPHSREYLSYLSSFQWYIKSSQVRERANYKCELCGKGGRLEVHHKTYQNLGNEPLDDLLALCGDCHLVADAKRKAEAKDRIYFKRVNGWASKVYGDDWEEMYPGSEVYEEFDEWLERKRTSETDNA